MPSIVEPGSNNPQVRLWRHIRALEERIAALERNGIHVPVVTGNPGAGVGRDGNLAVEAGGRLWIKVNGAWVSNGGL